MYDVAGPELVFSSEQVWLFLPVGYLTTILIEAPIVFFGLSWKLSWKERLGAGFWLTACTYPIVILVLPAVMDGFSRGSYLLVAEIFAPVAECVLFWFAFRSYELVTPEWVRCYLAIIVANVTSFLLGEILNTYLYYGLF